jgi:RNA polymerase sigma-70 factor (ECF subfamily)
MISGEKDFLDRIADHERLIHKVCRLYADESADREDLFQEILCQAWRSYAGFREESRFSTWLYRVALNTAITHLRKKRRPGDVSAGEEWVRHEAPTDPYAEEVDIMYAAINRLSKIDKAIILLYLEDCSYDDMSDIMGMSVSNIGVRLNRIRKRLKEDCEHQKQGRDGS